jgi:glycosyltransferase involved in cell wall biosynthesis
LLFISADLGADVKGLGILLKAIKLLTWGIDLGHASNIQLHLVGGGEMPIEDNHSFQVIRHGFLGRNEIRKLMLDSSFLVVPSLSENSPNVIAEAQLIGLPVIASRIAGISELIEDTVSGFLGDPNPQGISEAIRHAFATKDLTRVVLDAQSQARERYDIQSITGAHLAVYKRALANQ